MRKMIIHWDDKTDTSIKTVIGIDPDVEKNGVATLCLDNRRTMDITTHTFPELLEYLNVTRDMCRAEQKTVMVVIEAGWLNKSNWHLNGKDGKITHEELASFTGVKERTNQEGRDAALLAWTYAGLPIRMKTNGNKL